MRGMRTAVTGTVLHSLAKLLRRRTGGVMVMLSMTVWVAIGTVQHTISNCWHSVLLTIVAVDGGVFFSQACVQ
jgi:hypothetical protein